MEIGKANVRRCIIKGSDRTRIDSDRNCAKRPMLRDLGCIEYRTRIVTRRTFRRSSGAQEDRFQPITKLVALPAERLWISRFPCVTHPRTCRAAILFLRLSSMFVSWYSETWHVQKKRNGSFRVARDDPLPLSFALTRQRLVSSVVVYTVQLRRCSSSLPSCPFFLLFLFLRKRIHETAHRWAFVIH